MNMWDEEYSGTDYVYGTAPNDFLRENVAHLPKGRILCLAEGEGRNAVFLAQQGYDVTAVDYSQVGLDKASKLAAAHQMSINCVCESLETYDLGENTWDGIISISCHLPSAIRKPLYEKLVKALKPNGVFLIEGYTPEQLQYKTGGPPSADMMNTKASLQAELHGLTFDHLETLTRVIEEGANHTGMGAVIQAIASPSTSGK